MKMYEEDGSVYEIPNAVILSFGDNSQKELSFEEYDEMLENGWEGDNYYGQAVFSVYDPRQDHNVED